MNSVSAKNLVIRGGTLVTMDKAMRVLEADVLVRSGIIVRIGRIPGPDRGRKILDASGKVVVPGFVQTHVHLCQTLLRGMAEDMPLLEWLKKVVWPGEAAMDDEMLRVSVESGLCEVIGSGTTTIQDMGTVHGQDIVFDSIAAAGIRAFAGKAMMDRGAGVPKGLKESTRDSLNESESLCRRWNGSCDGLVNYSFAPRFVLSCSPRLLAEVGPVAREMGARIHTHASEQVPEVQAVRRMYGKGNIEVLAEFGLLGDDVGLAHCVHISKSEMRLLAKTGTGVLHCPSANMKLGSGTAKVPEMISAGVSLSLGADGAPCNNNLNPFMEMRLASLMQKARLGPRTMSAEQVLAMATIGGAEVLGIDHLVGSIEVGKQADLAVLDLDGWSWPGGDVYSSIVFASGPRNVTHVLVKGRPLLWERRYLTLEPGGIASMAAVQRKRLASML